MERNRQHGHSSRVPHGDAASERPGFGRWGIVNITSLSSGGISVTFTASAELYDPATGNWTTTSSMTTPRSGQGATLLQNGQVLVAGGIKNFDGTTSYSPVTLASAELYDPFTNTWTLNFGQAYGGISAGPLVLIGTGKVLLAGGKPKYGSVTGASMLYHWVLIGSLNPRAGHTPTRLQNGQVLAAGGSGLSGVLASAQLYTP